MTTFTVQPWLMWALLSAAFAAATAILAKIGATGISPDMATFIRTIVVAAALLVLLGASRQFQDVSHVTARGWTFLTLSGLATGVSWLCYFRALQAGDVALVAPIDKLSAVLVALAGVTLLGESLSPRQWAGVMMMGSGGVLIALR